MRAPARLRVACLAALLPLGLTACVTSPDALRLEDRPTENLVRIVNPLDRAVDYYVSPVRYSVSSPYRDFQVRYRDRDGRMVALESADSDGWWTIGVLSSELPVPVGRAPAELQILAAGGAREYSRSELLEWHGGYHHRRPPIAGHCTAQIRLPVRSHPRATDHVEIVGDWQPAPCPKTYALPS